MPLGIKKIGCAPANFREGRPSHLQIEAVVIHIIDGSQFSADATFLNPTLELKRSAHYSISRTGEIHQYIDEQDTAFHCGIVDRPTWSGLKRGPTGVVINPNFYTIGIEHEGGPRTTGRMRCTPRARRSCANSADAFRSCCRSTAGTS